MGRIKKSHTTFIALATAGAVAVAGLVVAQTLSVSGDPVVLTYDSQRLSDTRASARVPAGESVTVPVPTGESISVVLTAVQPSATGFLSFDGGTTSALSWSGTGNASTLAHAYTGGADAIEVFASVETHVLVDLVYVVNKSDEPASTTTTTPPVTTSPPATTTVPTTVDTSGSGTTYVQSFDTAASLDDMIFEIQDRRPFNSRGMTWTADHAVQGDSCGGPDTQRELDSMALQYVRDETTHFNNDLVRAEGFAYWCPVGANHLMTSFNSGGYYHMDFRPDQVFTDVSRICWDQNSTAMGPGKWSELTIVPLDVFRANGERMDYAHPSRDDTVAKWALRVENGVWKGQFSSERMDSSNNRTTVDGSRGITTQEKAARPQHCVVDNGDGTVTMSRDRVEGGRQVDVLPGTFPAGEAVVVWSDVGYNPNKRPDHDADENTFHWDNLIIESA